MRRWLWTRGLAAGLVVALAGLLVYPLHVRYQNPDQDVPMGLALADLARGGWRPATLVYPSGLTNLLRLGLDGWLAWGGPQAVSRAVGAFCARPWDFRMAPRIVAVAAGVATLAAVLRLGALAGGAACGVLAAALLGTSLLFVREHHHGMLDGPAAAAAAWATALAARHVASPSLAILALAGACAGLAASVKYNLAVALVAPVTAVLLAPTGSRARVRALAMVALAALAAFALATPGAILEPGRLATELHEFAGRQARLLQAEAPPGSNRLVESLHLGLGWPLLAASLAGIVVGGVRRLRVLAPVVAVLLAYGGLLAASPLVINRYALPLAAPLAVLAAVGVSAVRPATMRLAIAAWLVLVGLSAVVPMLRLLATEDTRVAAARWIEEHLDPDVRLFLACTTYAAPDLATAMLDPFRQVPGGLGIEPPPGCTARRRMAPALGGTTPAELAALYRGGVVVTCEHPAPELARAHTPPALLAALAAHAEPLADFPVALSPGGRVYEPFDVHYVPLVGAATVDRPGPRIRLWRVPGPAAAAAPSPAVTVPRGESVPAPAPPG